MYTFESTKLFITYILNVKIYVHIFNVQTYVHILKVQNYAHILKVKAMRTITS